MFNNALVKIVGTEEKNDNKKEGKENTVERLKVVKINKYAKITT